MRKIINAVLTAALAAATLVTVTPTSDVVGHSKQATVASVSSTPKRHTAMRWAKTQKGDRYCYGGNGPSCWDCSGIVVAAYKKVGITLPRTTYDMIKSSKLSKTSSPRWGDIVFTSSGHVELYSHKEGGVRWMFGAHNSSKPVGYARVYSGASGYPKYFRVKGAG